MNQLRCDGWLHHLARHAVACFLTRGDLWQVVVVVVVYLFISLFIFSFFRFYLLVYVLVNLYLNINACLIFKLICISIPVSFVQLFLSLGSMVLVSSTSI